MNRILLLLLFCITVMTAQGQSNEQDYRIVFLKDGSVLKGYLVQDTPPMDGIKIKLLNGTEMFIENSFIKKTKRPKRRLMYFGDGRSIKGKGSYGALHIHTLMGYYASQNQEIKEKRVGLGLHYVLGHKFSEPLSLGIGMGLDTYSDNILASLFADVRGIIGKKPARVNMTYNFILGYSIHSGILYENTENNTWRGGLLVYPNIGVRFARRQQSNIFLDFGYKFQYSEHEFLSRWWNDYQTIDKIWYKNLVLRVGWEF